MLGVVRKAVASLFALAACGVGFAVAEPGTGTPSTITGVATVIDGDKITIDGQSSPKHPRRESYVLRGELVALTIIVGQFEPNIAGSNQSHAGQ